MNCKENGKADKKVLGLPVRWEKNKMFSNFFNRNDDRILPPKFYGIGWDVNFHALFGAIKNLIRKT